MVSYVLGFLFSSDYQQVLLLKKTRGLLSGQHPQAGRINGIGGHIEPGESSLQAMAREFEEETGLPVKGWKEFGLLRGEGFAVGLYYTTASIEVLEEARNSDGEQPVLMSVRGLEWDEAVVPNLRWMIPMALSFDRGEHARYFDVEER